MKMKMSDRIAQLLQEKDMTQKELSEAANMTESAISHYMKGDRVPRGVNLIKIAKALGTTADYLLGQDDCFDRDSDIRLAKTLIARNSPGMSKEEKMELISILMESD